MAERGAMGNHPGNERRRGMLLTDVELLSVYFFDNELFDKLLCGWFGGYCRGGGCGARCPRYPVWFVLL